MHKVDALLNRHFRRAAKLREAEKARTRRRRWTTGCLMTAGSLALVAHGLPFVETALGGYGDSLATSIGAAIITINRIIYTA